MPRPIRAFTLSEEVSCGIDRLTKCDPLIDVHMRILLHEPDVVDLPPLDRNNLSTQDYADMYAMLPLPKHAQLLPNFQTLHRNVYSYCNSGEAGIAATAMIKELNKRQKANGILARKLRRKVTASGVANALLSLGLEALAGKVTPSDTAGSTHENAGEAGHKRTHLRRR